MELGFRIILIGGSTRGLKQKLRQPVFLISFHNLSLWIYVGEAGCISALRGERSEITQASWILNPRCLFGRGSAGFSIVQGLQMGVGWLPGDGRGSAGGGCIGKQRHRTRTAWDSTGLQHTAAWRVLGSTGGEWMEAGLGVLPKLTSFFMGIMEGTTHV